MYQTVSLQNVDMAAVDTEYTLTIPKNTRKINIRSRLNGAIAFATDTGFLPVSGDGSLYNTIPAGSGGLWLDQMYLNTTTLYVESTKANDVLEVIIIKD